MLIRAVVIGYPPSSLVGSWITTHEFLRHMAASGHRVEVHPYAIPSAETEHEGVVIRHDMGKPLAADVVIGHAGDDGASRNLADRIGAPLVLMVHGGELAKLPGRVKAADLAVFNSETLREQVAHDVPSIVCHPPTSLEAYRTELGDRVTLVNLSPEKGGDLFWRLVDTMPGTDFLGVRGGYGTQQMFTGAPNVKLHRTTPDMRDVYSKTRVLLMPSEAESWGRVGLEAAASGIPTIAHPTLGIIECLGDSATYVDRGDDQGWREAIAELADPEVYEKRSRLARERADSFDAQGSLDRFREAIECL